ATSWRVSAPMEVWGTGQQAADPGTGDQAKTPRFDSVKWCESERGIRESHFPMHYRTVGCDAKKLAQPARLAEPRPRGSAASNWNAGRSDYLSRDRQGAGRCIPCHVAGLRCDNVGLVPLPLGRGSERVGKPG